MARSIFAVLLVASTAFISAAALQVSPNSQCSSVCQDGFDQDKSNATLSNTVGHDVICHDSNYATPAGQKFKKCIECLQESSDKSGSESDLQWFLYNIRYAVSTCLFSTVANASDPISSPCRISSSCEPLTGALQEGLINPSSENRFSYCSAYGASFLGPRLNPCTRCLQLTDEQKYMGNFMVALKAGCTQKPEPGKIIGLDGSMFSKTAVNATTEVHVVQPTTPVETNRGGLTTGAYAGIGVAGAAIVAVLAVICFIGRRKKVEREKRDEIASRLDDQFGHGRMAAPGGGGFGDPYSSQGSPYQNVGMTNVRSEKPYGTPRNQREHEQYYPEPQYQQRLSTYSQHQQQGVREVGAPIPYANYNHSRMESPTPAYSPALSAHHETPTNSPSSTTRLHHPLSNNESSIPTTSHPGQAAGESAVQTRPTISISTTNLLPGPPPPPGNATRHTRDLSVGRDTDDVEESKKKAERQRLYQLGFKNN